jgi:hypothetical protein
MHCGENMPRSCECFRQCRRFYCKGGKGACEMPRDPWYVRCFERVQQHPGGNSSSSSSVSVAGGSQHVYSDVPEEWEEHRGLVSWHLGIRADLQRQKLTREQATKVRVGVCAVALVLALALALALVLVLVLVQQQCGRHARTQQHLVDVVCAALCPPLAPGTALAGAAGGAGLPRAVGAAAVTVPRALHAARPVRQGQPGGHVPVLAGLQGRELRTGVPVCVR